MPTCINLLSKTKRKTTKKCKTYIKIQKKAIHVTGIIDIDKAIQPMQIYHIGKEKNPNTDKLIIMVTFVKTDQF